MYSAKTSEVTKKNPLKPSTKLLNYYTIYIFAENLETKRLSILWLSLEEIRTSRLILRTYFSSKEVLDEQL